MTAKDRKVAHYERTCWYLRIMRDLAAPTQRPYWAAQFNDVEAKLQGSRTETMPDEAFR